MRTMRMALGAALVLVATACGGGDDSAEDAGEDEAATTTSAAATTQPAVGSATAPMPTIGVSDFTFKPASVPREVTVRLANGDSSPHTVESKDGLWRFDEATQTFTAPATPGAYAIFCAIHTSMAGTLTVT